MGYFLVLKIFLCVLFVQFKTNFQRTFSPQRLETHRYVCFLDFFATLKDIED